MVILNKYNLAIKLLSTCLFFQVWDWQSGRNLGNLKALFRILSLVHNIKSLRQLIISTIVTIFFFFLILRGAEPPLYHNYSCANEMHVGDRSLASYSSFAAQQKSWGRYKDTSAQWSKLSHFYMNIAFKELALQEETRVGNSTFLALFFFFFFPPMWNISSHFMHLAYCPASPPSWKEDL